MNLKNYRKLTPDEKLKLAAKEEQADLELPADEALPEEKPAKRVKRQATPEQLANPLHGVKLAQVLEQLVEHYGWEYLADRVNIRCFKYNPTMKSSLGFLRKTQWAREHVQDIFVEMKEG